MKVTLIDFTGKGHTDPAHYAAALLAFTKNTRLNMTAGGLNDFLSKSKEDLDKELSYMANTIPSSWEFVDYTFMIEGVTRAFTHQFVRTRTASFAQQTMRVLDVSTGPGWDYLAGPTIVPLEELKNKHLEADKLKRSDAFHTTMDFIAKAYKEMIENGAAIEDARGVLPTNILTNIVAKMNMRTFVEMARKRSSSRTQGEYRDVLEQMKVSVREVHPWIDFFIDRDIDRAIADLEYLLNKKLEGDDRINAVKLLDQMRAQS